jgi:Mn-dependent DtxR family transcriptional regulator
MGQADIMDLLDKHTELSSKDMAEILNVSRSSINTNLNRLIKQGYVVAIEKGYRHISYMATPLWNGNNG